MKREISIAFALMSLLVLFAAAEETWTMGAPHTWARDKDAIKLEKLPDGGFEVRYASDTDWCVNGFPRIDVKRGDMFEMTCDTEALADAPGLSPVGFSAILRDESGKEVSWSFGGGHAKPGESVKTAFMVPRGVVTIQPRVLGRGAVGVRVRNLRVRRTGNILPASSVAHGGDVLSNGLLCGIIDGARFCVADGRTGRTWKPADVQRIRDEEISRWQEPNGSVHIEFINPETLKRWRTSYRVEEDCPEVVVTVESEGEMKSSIAYPDAFATQKGDRLIVPMNEGISYPGDWRRLDGDHRDTGRRVDGGEARRRDEALDAWPEMGRPEGEVRLRAARPLCLLRQGRVCRDVQALPRLREGNRALQAVLRKGEGASAC